MATTAQGIDEARVEEFVGKVIGDFSGAMATVLTAIGDKLGLFRALAEDGPADQRGAGPAGSHRRALRARVAAWPGRRRLPRAPRTGASSLPAEHQPVFAQEGGPVFMCGGYQEFLAVAAVLPQLVRSFRDGGGVAQSEYPPDFWEGLRRFTAGWHENHLVQEWIPAVPDVKAKLEVGCRYADVGSGPGPRADQARPGVPELDLRGLRRIRGLPGGSEGELRRRPGSPTA